MKVKECARVCSQEKIAENIYNMWIECPSIASQALAGQFITLYTRDSSALLPRPISLCEIDSSRGLLRIVYRIAGKGTREFSGYKANDRVEIMGPLGNGFAPFVGKGRRALVIGGGIGIPPMLSVARLCGPDTVSVLGYRSELFLNEEFEKCSRIYIATEDGSAGVKGTVLDAIYANKVEADVIYACGPAPMLRAIKEYAAKRQIPCYISLEERMACGIGACLACVCQTTQTDAHSNVHNSRICKDGPVFDAGMVLI